MKEAIIMDVNEFESRVKKAVEEALVKLLPDLLNTSINTREDDDLIGTAEACKILGIGSRTMQRYRDRKCFNVVMRGPHKALYYRSEILAFRNANQINAR
jgi:hypothetical protein